MCVELVKLVERHGLEAVQQWKDESKNRHRLMHIAVCKNYSSLIQIMVGTLGFNVNIPRDSDQCTPMHLAMFYTKAQSIKKLKDLGADLSLKNSYGESCDAKYANFVNSYQHIIWLDMEFTHGHYESLANHQQVLEAGLIITDKDLNELGRGHWVVGGYTQDFLLSLAPWHQEHFCDAQYGGAFPPKAGAAGGNGLFSDILAATKTLDQVSNEMVKLILQHCPDKACPLAGMSVQCDREVLKLQMPKVYSVLNHRIVDVSSFLGMAERWLPDTLSQHKEHMRSVSNYNHRAINDCESAIHSMRWIRTHMLVQPDIL